MDWRYGQSCWYFQLALWTIAPLTLPQQSLSHEPAKYPHQPLSHVPTKYPHPPLSHGPSKYPHQPLSHELAKYPQQYLSWGPATYSLLFPSYHTCYVFTLIFNPLMQSTFFSNFFFKFTGDMPFRAQMTNIYSFFSYLKIYPPFLAKNFTSLLGRECVTPSRVTFPYFSWICTCKWRKNDNFTLFLTN